MDKRKQATYKPSDDRVILNAIEGSPTTVEGLKKASGLLSRTISSVTGRYYTTLKKKEPVRKEISQQGKKGDSYAVFIDTRGKSTSVEIVSAEEGKLICSLGGGTLIIGT